MDDEKIEKNGWSYEHGPVDGHVLKHEFDENSTTTWNLIYNGFISDRGWYLKTSDHYSDGTVREGTPTMIHEDFAQELIAHWSSLEEWA